MGTTKTAAFTQADIAAAKYAKALAHPARIAILRILVERRACICGDIVEELPLSQSTVSQHLKELKESGLIKGDVEGKKVCYCIDAQVWQQAQQVLGGLFAGYLPRHTSCC
ncbi:winged helix-turn-helix transcriptional regulator [Pontibacter sp. 172403-2]|uniref:ArsR/SmtB family transcription factor n=1 Tax=Pontibacter rufus TaxID=2791028 RepID=UPI0018AFA64C|nr:metalloregulator ArsR/SmtB family transcription factor [Pontibacter sp. 172403-2]MBF9253709.1 winged helix-turn-helix transcriptional regulator [Pontibacter sp. 172403-2]